MTQNAVLYERTGHVATLTLNRPTNRNSMTEELLGHFEEAVGELRADRFVRCAIVTGKGSCFSAGADLNANMQLSGALPHEASYAMYAPFLTLLDVDVPVIAALNGHAVGGGFGLSLLADIRIANSDAKYGANFARLGIHSGLGISFLLPRLIGTSHAYELLLTGKLISGTRAADIGLCSQAVQKENVLTVAQALAEEIAAAAPIPVRTIKQSIRRGLGWDIPCAALAEAHLQSASLQTQDAKEGMAALLEKREPTFHGR